MNIIQQCIALKCCNSAEWIRYIAIYLGLQSKCRFMVYRLTSIYSQKSASTSWYPMGPTTKPKKFSHFPRRPPQVWQKTILSPILSEPFPKDFRTFSRYFHKWSVTTNQGTIEDKSQDPTLELQHPAPCPLAQDEANSSHQAAGNTIARSTTIIHRKGKHGIQGLMGKS